MFNFSFTKLIASLVHFVIHILQDAHHKVIDDSEIIVDYNRQRLMSGWIPRRLG